MVEEYFEAQFPELTRAEEITKIIQYIKEGNSCQLVGMPGVSRSTILGLLANNGKIQKKYLKDAQKDTHFVIIDFSEIKNRSLFDVMKFLFLNLTESLRERGLTEENKIVGDKFREHLQFNDELVLFQGFKEAVDYLALERKMTVVFLFSRFEEYIRTVPVEFFSNLRILRNRAKYQFSIVFSVNRPLEDLLEPSLLADYYEYVAGKIVYVSLYDEVFAKHRLSYIEKVSGKQLEPKVFDSVMSLTGGHGKLTKIAVESLLGHGEIPDDLQKYLLTQKTIKSALREVWFSLSPAEQSDILENSFEEEEVRSYLQNIGLLKENTIQIPLLSAFVASEYGVANAESKKIIYDQNTNTIKKGATVLSDQLTSSEFRLLTYLLQNEDQIVDREELINVVWSNMKSTAGITDQAVDQLIFRVRRKIEEDANHPTHLHTIKGRGFKFNS